MMILQMRVSEGGEINLPSLMNLMYYKSSFLFQNSLFHSSPILFPDQFI
jgi:hypothetical protein